MTAHLFPDNTVFCNFACVGRLDLLETYLSGRGRWTEAVAFEVQQSSKYLTDLTAVPLGGWMGEPIEIDDEQARAEVEGIRRSVFGGIKNEPLKHLGESQTLWVIRNQYGAGDAFWLSDDRETVDYARGQGLVVRQTRDIVAALVQAGEISDTAGYAMMKQMHELDRVVEIPASASEFWAM